MEARDIDFILNKKLESILEGDDDDSSHSESFYSIFQELCNAHEDRPREHEMKEDVNQTVVEKNNFAQDNIKKSGIKNQTNKSVEKMDNSAVTKDSDNSDSSSHSNSHSDSFDSVFQSLWSSHEDRLREHETKEDVNQGVVEKNNLAQDNIKKSGIKNQTNKSVEQMDNSAVTKDSDNSDSSSHSDSHSDIFDIFSESLWSQHEDRQREHEMKKEVNQRLVDRNNLAQDNIKKSGRRQCSLYEQEEWK